MLDWFLGLFTASGLVQFSAGVGAACVYHYVKAHLKGRVVVFKWQYMAVPLVLGIAGFITIQTQQNANCVREFQQVLRVRAAITTENDQLSIQQRQIIYNWIHGLIFPPPPISDLDTEDPVRQKWALQFTIETDKTFRASINQQHENDRERAEHPLPAPTCGE